MISKSAVTLGTDLSDIEADNTMHSKGLLGRFKTTQEEKKETGLLSRFRTNSRIVNKGKEAETQLEQTEDLSKVMMKQKANADPSQSMMVKFQSQLKQINMKQVQVISEKMMITKLLFIKDELETDNLNRNIAHKNALDQNFSALLTTLQKLYQLDRAEVKENESEHSQYLRLKELVNRKDIYGNTPLALACINNSEFEFKKREKLNCIALLLTHFADPNQVNNKTGFTPLHWAARYGELEICKLLCEGFQNAMGNTSEYYDYFKPPNTENHELLRNSSEHVTEGWEFLPDTKGHTPLDYAGIFKHEEVIKYLINRTRQRAELALKDYIKGTDQGRMSVFFKSTQTAFSQYLRSKRATNLENKKFADYMVLNPLMRANLIHWASSVTSMKQGSEENLETHLSDFNKLLEELHPDPSFQNMLDKNRCAIHQAAIQGNHSKLQLLLKRINCIYLKGCCETKLKHKPLKNEQGIRQDDENFYHVAVCNSDEEPDKEVVHKLDERDKDITIEQEFKAMLLSRGYWRYLNHYVSQMNRCRHNFQLINQNKFDIDFQDGMGMSPLHYACQLDKDQCVFVLLILNGASLDLSNEAGIRPREMLQNKKTKQRFQEFYNLIDKMMQNEKEFNDLGSTMEQKDQAIFKNIMNTLMKFDTNDDHDLIQERGFSSAFNSIVPQICFRNLMGFYLKRLKNEQINELISVLRDRIYMPEVCSFAIKVKFSNDKNSKNSKLKLNEVIKSLIEAGFQVRMFPVAASWPNHLKPENTEFQYWVTLEMDLNSIMENAEKMEYEMKLIEGSIKHKYVKSLRNNYEPFRSKDTQAIYYKVLTQCLNLEQLKQNQIFIEILFLHDQMAISDIEHKYRLMTWRETFEQNIRDDKKQTYNALTTIKNYIGEKYAFQYAFLYFYTTWLFIPSLFGILCQISNWSLGSSVSMFSFVYGIIVCIWITFFIERWRRKENELKLIWGLYIQETDDSSKIRDEFLGNEQFSMTSYQVDKKDLSKSKYFYKMLNLWVSIIIVAASVASFTVLFLAQQEEKQKNTGFDLHDVSSYTKYFIGVANGIVITFFDFLYRSLATKLIDLENIRTEKQYQSAFIHKLFIFKIINANLSIILTIYIRRDLASLNNLLLGQMTTRVVTILISKIIVPYLKYYLKKHLYFKQIRKNAEIQKGIQKQNLARKEVSEEEQESVDMYNRGQEDKKRMPLFNFLLDAKNNYQWLRPISRFSNKIRKNDSTYFMEKEPFLVDQVELNSLMKPTVLHIEISETINNYVLLSYACFYSFICPMLMVIIFFYNFLCMKFERKVHFTSSQRTLVINSDGLGAWNYILLYLGHATIIANCVFMYWLREDLAVVIERLNALNFMFPTPIHDAIEFFKDVQLLGPFVATPEQKFLAYTDRDMLLLTIVIVCVEHLIFLFKGVIVDTISNVPKKVEQRAIGATRDLFDIQLAINEQRTNQAQQIKRLKKYQLKQKQHFESEKKQLVTAYDQIQKERRNLEQQIKQKVTQYESLQLKMKQIVDEKRMKLELNKQRAYELKIDPVRPALSKYVSYRAGTHINLVKYENVLDMGVQKRMFRGTYYYVERAILSRRMGKVCKGLAVVNCGLCEDGLAERVCEECGGEPICDKCIENHDEGLVTMKHRTMAFKRVENGDQRVRQIESENPWRKFEKFDFILDKKNEFYNFLRLYFVFMKETYLATNNISNHSDLVKFILDQRFSMFGTENQDKILKFFKDEQEQLTFSEKQGVNQFELEQLVQSEKSGVWSQQTGLRGGASMSSAFHGKLVFNDEEMLFLNRAALILFSDHGHRLTFDLFLVVIRTLQNGGYGDKVRIAVQMMKEGRKDQKYILVDHIVEFFMASMPQTDYSEEYESKVINPQSVLINLFSNGADLQKTRAILIPTEMVFKTLLDAGGPARELIKCVLQISD